MICRLIQSNEFCVCFRIAECEMSEKQAVIVTFNCFDKYVFYWCLGTNMKLYKGSHVIHLRYYMILNYQKYSPLTAWSNPIYHVTLDQWIRYGVKYIFVVLKIYDKMSRLALKEMCFFSRPWRYLNRNPWYDFFGKIIQIAGSLCYKFNWKLAMLYHDHRLKDSGKEKRWSKFLLWLRSEYHIFNMAW